MNLNDLFPGKYLRAADLQGKSPVVTIAGVTLEPMGRTRELKAVIAFRGKAKGLKVNRTVAVTIAAIAGSEDTDRWAGVAVQLFATTADFGGQTYDVIRVKAPGAKALSPQPPVIAPPRMAVSELAIDLLDSEIPF